MTTFLPKRITLFVLLSFVLLACQPAGEDAASPDVSQMSETELVDYARGIHDHVMTLDLHIDIPFTYATEEVDPGVRGDAQVDLPKMEEGGLDAGFFIVYVGQTERTPENYEKAKADAMTKFNAIHRMTSEMYPEQIGLAHSAEEARQIYESGRKVALIGIENGYVIGKDLALLEKYYDLGARYITLAHGGHNDIADSSTPRPGLGDGEEEHGGISDFGEEVIAEMNRLGIMVDVSHISKNASIEAAQLSQAPIIASHSSTSELAPVARNMDDEQLLALKETGGVVHMVALGGYVKEDSPERLAAINQVRQEMGLINRAAWRTFTDEQRAEYRRRIEELNEQYPGPSVQDFVNHIDYAVDLIGIDHVGIASDFDGGGGITGWQDASETFNVTLELVRRGYSEEEIAKIWSGNTLRVLEEVEQIAARLQQEGS